jgi:hypothetical protein
MTFYLADAVRNLGNNVRHPGSRAKCLPPICMTDAEMAVAFTQRVCNWFCAEQTDHCAEFDDLSEQTINTTLLLDRLYAEQGQLPGFVSRLEPELKNRFFCSPALPCVLGEELTEIKGPEDERYYDEAISILLRAYEMFGNERRTCQLIALCCSRKHDSFNALLWLEENWPDDETYGIRGGAHKREWKPGDRKTECNLRDSYYSYSKGWVESRCRNPYLGINAATTALFFGHITKSTELANEVLGLIKERKGTLKRHGIRLPLSYWDSATLAEAKLLLDDENAADELFAQAKSEHPACQELFDVTANQFDLINRKKRGEF